MTWLWLVGHRMHKKTDIVESIQVLFWLFCGRLSLASGADDGSGVTTSPQLGGSW